MREVNDVGHVETSGDKWGQVGKSPCVIRAGRLNSL